MAPSALTSQGSPSITVPAKPPQPTPETSPEAVVPEVSLSEEIIALEQRIVQFEIAEKRHVEQAAEDKQRVIEAVKRATAAEIETKAATARAQDRYTEKMHANNETRNLMKERAKVEKERADFLVGVQSIIQCRDEKIAKLKEETNKLEEEKANGEWAKKLTREFTKQIDIFQEGYVASTQDKKVSDKIISQLKSDRDSLGTINKNLKSVIAQLRKDIDTEREKSKAASEAPTKDQIEARIAAAKAGGFEEGTVATHGKNAEQKKLLEEKAKAQVEWVKKSLQTQAQEYLRKWRSEEGSLLQKVSVAEAALFAANKEIAKLQKDLMEASAPSRSVPNDAQRPPKRGQPTSSYGAFDSNNKRRRLDLAGAAGITTPDFQRTHSNSLPSDTNDMSPLSALWTNGETMIGDTQMQKQARNMAPNDTHGRSSSQQSNGSAVQMGHTRRSSQQPSAIMAAPPVHKFGNMPSQQQGKAVQNGVSGYKGSQSPRFPQHNLGLMRTSPQVGRQMENGQQMISQAGNINSYDGDLLQQMQRSAQSQIQSQMSTPAQGSMGRTSSYGSASFMASPQPHVAQHSSNQFAPLSGQNWNMGQNFEQQNLPTNGTDQGLVENYTPTMEELDSNFAFDVDALIGDVGAAYAGSQPVLEDTYDGNDWFPTEENLTQTALNSTLPSNRGPPMPQGDFQQPQQRGYQTHSRNHSQPYERRSRDMSHGSESLKNEPIMNMSRNGSRQPSVSGRATRASSRSTPGPSARTRRKTPGSTEPGQVPCVNCYRHWWEGECDEGEPCSNCVATGTKCVRQKCVNYAAGTCDKGNKCPNVHEGDGRYQNEEFLVAQTKAGKRPSRMSTRVDAKPAPATSQQD